jgi:hypothetical protein
MECTGARWMSQGGVDARQRREASESAVGMDAIVEVERCRYCGQTLLLVLVRVRVRRALEQGANEALGLAVGVGPSASVGHFEAVCREQSTMSAAAVIVRPALTRSQTLDAA